MNRIPRIEVLAIGDELLDGRVADTNTLYLAQQLRELGLGIQQRSTVKDSIDVIVKTAQQIIERGTTICVVSGGLGPTTDDLTREAFAELAQVELERVPRLVKHLEELFDSRGRELTDNQLKQADRPKGAETLDNALGTAPGFSLMVSGCRFVSVPGVPREYHALVHSGLLDELAREQGGSLPHRHFRCFGLVEGEIDRRLAPIHTRWPGVRVGYRAHFPEIHVSLSGDAQSEKDVATAGDFAREILGRAVFSEEALSLPQVLLNILKDRGETLALAESCTGGLAADLLTDIPGSSAVLLASAVCYSNEAKQHFVGVSAQTLEDHGAVSEQTVREMAQGVAEATGATHALSISGIAGPGGGTAEKPVGTVWLGFCGPDGVHARLLNLSYGRRRNKQISAYAALNSLRRYLQGESWEQQRLAKKQPIAP